LHGGNVHPWDHRPGGVPDNTRDRARGNLRPKARRNRRQGNSGHNRIMDSSHGGGLSLAKPECQYVPECFTILQPTSTRSGMSKLARLSVAVLLLTITLLFSSPPDFRPQFINVAAQAGLTFKHENGASPEKHLFETFGSGVAFIDYDNDGLPDLFFANGADLAHGKPSPGNALYRNLGKGRFEDVTAKAGLAGNGMFATGVTVGDYDN